MVKYLLCELKDTKTKEEDKAYIDENILKSPRLHGIVVRTNGCVVRSFEILKILEDKEINVVDENSHSIYNEDVEICGDVLGYMQRTPHPTDESFDSMHTIGNQFQSFGDLDCYVPYYYLLCSNKVPAGINAAYICLDLGNSKKGVRVQLHSFDHNEKMMLETLEQIKKIMTDDNFIAWHMEDDYKEKIKIFQKENDMAVVDYIPDLIVKDSLMVLDKIKGRI